MAIKNVALLGASGTLGPHILTALKTHPEFTPYVMNRHSSKSVYPRTHVITVPDDLDPKEVSKLLKESDIDAVIIAMAGSLVDQQKKLIDAAYDAGVKRIMPADFGSCDSADKQTNEVLPLMKGKEGVRDYLIEMCSRERPGAEKLTWTSLITGHMFDYGLKGTLLKFNVKERKVDLIDGGNIPFSASNLPFIAEAVIKVLEKPDQTKDKVLYVQSLHVTQLDVLAALEKATGDKFERKEESSKTLLEAARPKMLDGDGEAVEETVAVWGMVASDWVEREGFANGLLGLKEEDLDEAVGRIVQEMK